MAGMPDPKSRTAKIDAAEDAAINPKAVTPTPAPAAATSDDDKPITADQAAKNAAKWKADAEAFAKGAPAPKPSLTDRLKKLIGG